MTALVNKGAGQQGISISTLRIAVAGAGRMGQAVAAQAGSDDALAFAGIWRRGDDLDALLSNSDVLVDFSLPDATEKVLAAARRSGTALVCGVSGLSVAQMEAISLASSAIPIVYDRNMSLGIAVLAHSVREAAASLGSKFDVRIDEIHHVHKKDAPSGTALKLAEAIAAARGESTLDGIEIHSERHGEVPGDHQVTMRSVTEQLTFAHSVTTRDVFAIGAVRAAAWVVAQPPGQYRMQDVLFADIDQK